MVLIRDPRLRADALFIRAPSTIRADGPPSAQVEPRQFERHRFVQESQRRKHCALSAPTAFSLRIKSVSVEKIRLLIKPNWGGFYPRSSIARGCAVHPRAIEDPRGRAAVRASGAAPVRTTSVCPGIATAQALRALRANRIFSTDQKRIRRENTVIDKAELGSLLSKLTRCSRLHLRASRSASAYFPELSILSTRFSRKR